MSDHVEYALPFGPLGRLAHWLAHWLVVRHQLRAIFDYRERIIADRFGTAHANRDGSPLRPSVAIRPQT